MKWLRKWLSKELNGWNVVMWPFVLKTTPDSTEFLINLGAITWRYWPPLTSQAQGKFVTSPVTLTGAEGPITGDTVPDSRLMRPDRSWTRVKPVAFTPRAVVEWVAADRAST